MKTIDVHELEERISEILHLLRETGEIIEVTNEGEVIVSLVPAPRANRPVEVRGGAIWTDFDRLVDELDVRWPKGANAVEAVRDVRREL